MQTKTFTITRDYEIACKGFFPEGEIRHIILGVHGFAGDKDSSMLSKLAAACAPAGTALVCFDFPAHGQSPVGEECLTVENCRADLCAVFDHLTATYPNATKSLFATSFGGYTTLLCADKFRDCPLVLRAPAVTMPRLLLETVLGITREQFAEMGVIRCGFERPIDLPFSFVEELEQQEDLLQKTLTQPTLILHGDRDDIVPLADVRRFIAVQNTAELRVIPGADHRFKNPGELEQIVEHTKAFLSL